MAVPRESNASMSSTIGRGFKRRVGVKAAKIRGTEAGPKWSGRIVKEVRSSV